MENNFKTCPTCDGGGVTGKLYPSGHTEVTCEDCDGEGQVLDEEVPVEISAERLQAIQLEIADAYVNSQLLVLGMINHGELNYIKTDCTMPGGGKYLLQLVHVSGPKLNVAEWYARVKKKMQESENEPKS